MTVRLRQNGRSDPRSDGCAPPPIGREIRSITTEILLQLAELLQGHVYSPRIKLLNIRQVCEITGLKRSTIYDMVKRGTFPLPQQNLGKSLWRESVLIAWADANDPNHRNT